VEGGGPSFAEHLTRHPETRRHRSGGDGGGTAANELLEPGRARRRGLPAGRQRLLSSASWDADEVLNDVRDWTLAHLGDDQAILVTDLGVNILGA
jgi:hypothetical protein